MRKFALIVNPAAGNGRAGRSAPQAQHLLAAGGGDVVLLHTASLRHAAELAHAVVGDGRIAVALGGDGLVGRVAGALANSEGALGVLPCGRGNDVARLLRIPADLPGACRVLREGVERQVDLAEVEGRPYATIASAGIDSAVNVIAHRTRFIRGRAVYAYATLRALAAWRPAEFSLDATGVPPTSYVGYSFAAANGTTYGGGIMLAPGARSDDGLLDVVTIHQMSKLQVLRLFPLAYRGAHLGDPRVQVVQTPRATVDADQPFMVYADGEPVTRLPATFAALPRALRVLTPA